MRKLSSRILVALITLMVSVSSSWLLHRPTKPVPAEPAPCPIALPTFQAVPTQDEKDAAEYPEESSLSPWDIASFIDSHPQAKLQKLWKRLHVKDEQSEHSEFSECSNCESRLDYYDLDSEPGDEALLKISDAISESYRYLVFKQTGEGHGVSDRDGWRLIGHIDEWGKYQESQSSIVLSGGRPWLITNGQSASGSGVAFYHNRVFEVTKNRLNEVASYESEGHQSGWDACPTKEFTSRILDIQRAENQTRVKVEFNLDYLLMEDEDGHLFSKRQVATFVSANNSKQVLASSESTVTQRELEHIYTIDSMTEADFLKYNLSELLNLAKRGTKAQKNWLKEFLERCETRAEKQRLLAALAK